MSVLSNSNRGKSVPFAAFYSLQYFKKSFRFGWWKQREPVTGVADNLCRPWFELRQRLCPLRSNCDIKKHHGPNPLATLTHGAIFPSYSSRKPPDLNRFCRSRAPNDVAPLGPRMTKLSDNLRTLPWTCKTSLCALFQCCSKNVSGIRPASPANN